MTAFIKTSLVVLLFCVLQETGISSLPNAQIHQYLYLRAAVFFNAVLSLMGKLLAVEGFFFFFILK